MSSSSNVESPPVLNWPLMENNITREDIDCVIEFLQGNPILTQNKNVLKFEEEWSRWVGVKYSVFVNSGSSANLLSMQAIRIQHGKHDAHGEGEVIVSPFGWVSDIAAVLHNGFKPVFADIDPDTLGMIDDQVLDAVTDKTRAVLFVHAQGFNGITDKLLNGLKEKNIPLIEDVCESHGATFKGRRVGSFGAMSNFSFYYAHHLSTIEGGMICTDDEETYQLVRMLRSHGMVRELKSDEMKAEFKNRHADLNPDFIFAHAAHNVRNNEIGAVMGLNQIKRLDAEIIKRNENFKLFLDNLDSKRYKTDFALEGSSNYAFNLILREADQELWDKVESALRAAKVEFRRGSAGGGNQLRQPYLRPLLPDNDFARLKNLDHVHFFGCYMGNFPDLSHDKIRALCDILNAL